MNGFSVSITEPGTKKYPLHQHSTWEVMYYLSGSGYLDTQDERVPFQPGSIIMVPPKAVHGSVSQNGFVNISIRSDFGHLFWFDKILTLHDNPSHDGERLARLIFDNRNFDTEYSSALCNAYAHFLLQNHKYEKKINQAIYEIKEQASRHFSDFGFSMTTLLKESGYAEDYIRAAFKEATQLSPVDFLTKIRIDHAQKLFEIYGQSLSVSQVAEACGFDDTVYFSKRFKQFVGVSPAAYKQHK